MGYAKEVEKLKDPLGAVLRVGTLSFISQCERPFLVSRVFSQAGLHTAFPMKKGPGTFNGSATKLCDV